MGDCELDLPKPAAWHVLLKTLSGIDGICEWQLTSGVSFFMAMPDGPKLTDEGVQASSLVRYEEIASIIVRATQQLGGLRKVNDLGAFRAGAKLCGSVQFQDDGESLIFRAAP
jgi:hypothetical protein